jgi:hypothetical protein
MPAITCLTAGRCVSIMQGYGSGAEPTTTSICHEIDRSLPHRASHGRSRRRRRRILTSAPPHQCGSDHLRPSYSPFHSMPCIPGGRYSHTRAEASDAYCLLECPAGENARGARLVPVRSRPVRNWITPETNTKPTGARQSASGMDHPFRVRAGPVYPLAGCTIRCTIRGAGPQASAADWIGLGADRRDARGPRHPARFVCVHGQHA